jgi:hypothetical protein
VIYRPGAVLLLTAMGTGGADAHFYLTRGRSQTIHAQTADLTIWPLLCTDPERCPEPLVRSGGRPDRQGRWYAVDACARLFRNSQFSSY